MESFFGVITNDSTIFNTFFILPSFVIKWVSEPNKLGTTGIEGKVIYYVYIWSSQNEHRH